MFCHQVVLKTVWFWLKQQVLSWQSSSSPNILQLFIEEFFLRGKKYNIKVSCISPFSPLFSPLILNNVIAASIISCKNQCSAGTKSSPKAEEHCSPKSCQNTSEQLQYQENFWLVHNCLFSFCDLHIPTPVPLTVVGTVDMSLLWLTGFVDGFDKHCRLKYSSFELWQ